MDEPSVGVYVHVPFCERVCPYCDFAVVAAPRLQAARSARYVDAVLAELAARLPVFAGRRLASLYLGGGTPSLLVPEQIARIVAAVREAFPASPGQASPEITLEVNPGTLERERLAGFRAAGVERVSLGVQSFDDHTLKRLGRAHRAEEARRSLAAVREAGFRALSLDLIFAAPEQSPEAWEAGLEEALSFAPEHLSTYELTVEEGTPFATAAARGQLRRASEDEAVAMIEASEERLGAAGYRRYELSNFALPGFEAVHNRRYWERRPVLGLGLGAFSTDPPAAGAPFGVRRANTRDLERYCAGAPERAQSVERLDAPTARGEAAFLALRTAAGLDAAGFAREFGAPPREFWGDAIQALGEGGLLEEGAGGSLRLTARGRLVADRVFESFV